MATKKESAVTKRARTEAAVERNPKAKLTGLSEGKKAAKRTNVRDTDDGRYTEKANAKTDPKGTVTETVAPRAKGRAAKGRRPAEPRFVLVNVDHLSAGNHLNGEYEEPKTKGEMLAMLAEEIEHLPLNERQGKSVPFGIPATVGAAVDLLFTTRQDRLALTHRADALKVHETALRDHLINTLPKSDASGAAGKLARAQIKTDKKPVVTDWDAFYGHIAKKKEFDLLNRAVNSKAVKTRWDNGKAVPGVGTFEVVKVSMERIGGDA